MADMKLQSEQRINGGFPTFDYEVVDGMVPLIDGIEADSQAAALAAFLDQSMIPQLPGVGTRWTQFLLNEIQFADVDSDIRNNLNLSNLPFKPTYDTLNGNLVCTVVKQ